MSDIFVDLKEQNEVSEHRREARYLDRGIKYRRKQRKQSRRRTKSRHTTHNKPTITLEHIQPGMTIVDKNTFTQSPRGERLAYDGFGNLVTKDHEQRTIDVQVGGDFVKLEDLSKDNSTDKCNDLTWLYGNIQPSVTAVNLYTGDPGLSQLDSGKIINDPGIDDIDDEPERDEERIEIEEEIKRKFAELEGLMNKIQAVRGKRRRRHSKNSKRLRSYSGIVSGSVNVIPIERERRLAQPIRNALLIRTAMKRAWKGSLGSCCGMGCWAHWKWVNLKHVMSDYE